METPFSFIGAVETVISSYVLLHIMSVEVSGMFETSLGIALLPDNGRNMSRRSSIGDSRRLCSRRGDINCLCQALNSADRTKRSDVKSGMRLLLDAVLWKSICKEITSIFY